MSLGVRVRNTNTAAATLVTGGTGLIGGEVILEVSRQGRRVKALVRAASEAQARERLLTRLEKSPHYRFDLLEGIDVVAGDTAQEMFGTSAGALGALDTIIHCAANTQFSDMQDEEVWNTNVRGARHLVGLAQAAAPDARIVFVSTSSVVTAPERSCLHEDAAFAGHENTYTRSKREAEAIVQAGGLETIILRPSIVLSRGFSDRAMARSILWAVPIMAELGEVPIDPDAFIDLVPVDFVAKAIVRMAFKPTLRHTVYHVSAGAGANRFSELSDAVQRINPDLRPIRAVGRHARVVNRAQKRLMRPLSSYLPFLNASVRYANDRLVAELGLVALPAPAVSYVPDLVGFISVKEALQEMYQP